jgi:hypothetical protein
MGSHVTYFLASITVSTESYAERTMPTDTTGEQPQATGVRAGTVLSREVAYLTGGFKVSYLPSGDWSLEPILSNGRLAARVAPKGVTVGQVAGQANIRVVGFDQVTLSSPVLPNRLWRPFFVAPAPKDQPADAWSMITTQAYKANDVTFAQLARSIAISLRAAGMHLRSACDQYHLQLCDTLLCKQIVGHRFSNIALMDLHLAFHSMLCRLADLAATLAPYPAQPIEIKVSDKG